MFAGAEKMLVNAPPMIVFAEITPGASRKYGKPVPEFMEMMMERGYDIYRIDHRHEPPMKKGDESWQRIAQMEREGTLEDFVFLHRKSLDALKSK